MTFFDKWLKVKLTDQEQDMISNYEEDVEEAKNKSKRRQKTNDRQYMEEVYELDQWLAKDEEINQDLNMTLKELETDVKGIPHKNRFFNKWREDEEN